LAKNIQNRAYMSIRIHKHNNKYITYRIKQKYAKYTAIYIINNNDIRRRITSFFSALKLGIEDKTLWCYVVDVDSAGRGRTEVGVHSQQVSHTRSVSEHTRHKQNRKQNVVLFASELFYYSVPSSCSVITL